MPKQDLEIYSDLETTFTAHPVYGDVTRITNEDAIIRSIKNILLTNYYERPMQPEFGANLVGLLFENFGPLTEISIQKAIESAIRNYEPRCELIQVNVNPAPELNAYSATITFATINTIEPITFSFLLDRVR